MLVHGPWTGDPEVPTWPGSVRSAADEVRLASYRQAATFFAGDQWAERARRGEPDRLVFNYARAVIRKTTSYVFSGPVGVSVQADAALRDTANAAERRLLEIRDALDLGALDLALATDSAVLGDAAMKVTWDIGTSAPSVVAVDPAALVVRTAPDDPRRVEEVTHGYTLTGTAIREVFRRDIAMELEPDVSYEVLERWSDSRWQLAISGQRVHDGNNPYGWIPYVIVPNDRRPLSFWGSSDLTDLMSVCQELNRRMTVLAHVLELSGAPIAVLENVHGSEGIRVGPGAKWELPEGSKAYLLDLLQGGGAEVHLKYLDVLFRMLHDLSETPRTAFGDSGRDLSGAALEVEIQPLIQKVNRKRLTWDGVISARNARLLDLLERFGGESFAGLRRTRAIWPPVLPSDRESAVRNAVSMVGSGIQSRRGAMATLGESDPEAELARMREEADAAWTAALP